MIRRTAFFAGISLFFLNITPVDAATLTYVRIGVHKEFTRIVFELNKQALCEEPVEQSPGTCSIKLLNTKTDLNSTIPGQPKAKVKAIDLIKDESDLIAVIRLTYSQFEANSFILPNPYRIVLDIRPGQKPSIDRIANLKPGDKPKVKIQLPAASEQKLTEEAEISPQLLTAEARVGNETSKAPGDEEPSSQNQFKIIPENEDDRSTIYRIDPENQPAISRDNRLQIYLLAVLVLSTLTLTLLCFLVLRRSQAPKPERLKPASHINKVDKTLDLIDEKINEKIDELCQNLRFKEP
ncbi:MAG: hypothetical protein AB1659_09155 [Thermodesulfobacteriota bacterium]